MRKLILLVSFICSSIILNAQNILGKVVDENNKGVAGASIALQKAKDSSMVKVAISNKEGDFIIGNIYSGKYFVTVSI